ncbi:EF-hand domain-containing member C2 [Entophlyctis luteolus]|nr:EF-hand domain-containing member C2 [Entophlyctis luteolus]
MAAAASSANTLADVNPTERSTVASPGVPIVPASTSRLLRSMPLLPGHIFDFEKMVLRFYAYFQEAVHEKREEKYRVRRVNIYFYLEDDTIHVSEPKYANSGIPQDNSTNGQHFLVTDLNVQKEVTFYSRTFKIVGCDHFTREFLTNLKIAVPPSGEFPQDPYQVERSELLGRMQATRPYVPNTSLKNFLENDRRVLRFYCIWDDTNTVFGDVRHMVVHYYLSDDTIDIHECIPANSGRQSSSMFLNRCRLPKHATPGASSLSPNIPTEYFSDRDFTIGAVLHLNGRPFVICDCDGFTREFYREKYGLENFDPLRFEDYDLPASKTMLSWLSAAGTNGVGAGAKSDKNHHSDGRIRNILIDVGKFFRESALAWFSYYDIESIDAILVTHGHADAMLGFDDLRQWTMDAKVHASIPVYLNVATMAVVATTFPYLVDASLATGGGQVPSLEFVVFEKDASTNEYNSIDIEELRVIPFDVEHGTAGHQPYYSLGFKFPGITYISDTNRIPETAMSLIQDSDVLVLDGLRESEHSSHFSVTQAIQHALILKPRLFYITDFCHDVEHSKVEERLRLHPELNEAG